MTNETLNRCGKCSAEFYYPPTSHRCPGEWEAICGAPLTDPYAGMTWVEECMTKQHKAAS